MSDTASLYSTTATLIEQPLSSLAYDDSVVTDVVASSSSRSNETTYLPDDQCWAILVMSHDHYRADTPLMSRVGFPSGYGRSSMPGNNHSGIKKRLQVQFPIRTLNHDKIVRSPVPTTVEHIRQAREARGKAFGGRRTMLFLINEDIVGLRSRLLTSAGLTLLFHGSDIKNPTLFYPAHTVLRTPKWAAPKKRLFESKGPSAATQPAFVKTQVKWATLFFTSPAPPNSVDLEMDKESRSAREKIIMDRLRDGESDEEILARMQTPSEEREALLEKLLQHLERRGVLWGQAGHICKPSLLCHDPVRRPQFVIQGLYPEPFLDRCKAYCQAGASINGKNCMQPEAEESAKSSKSPLIVSSTKDLTTTEYASTTKESSEIQTKDHDLLQGWHVKVTLEPFQSGSPLTSGAGMVAAAGGMGGF